MNEDKTSTNERRYSVNIRWPPVYIACMLKLMYQVTSKSVDHQVLGDMLTLLKVDFLGQSSRVSSGTGWEIITKVAILLHCVCAFERRNNLNIMGIPFGIVTSVQLDRLNGVKTLEEAKAAIEKKMKPLPVGAVVLCYPSFSGFPLVDAILVYKESSENLEIVGIQGKLDNSYTTSDVPEWFTHAVLIQGNPPKERRESGIRKQWKNLTLEEVLDLLGFSLAPLIPANWNRHE